MNTRLFSQGLRTVTRCLNTRGFRTNQAVVMAPIKVGDQIPNVDLYEGTPGNTVNTKSEFSQGKHVIVAVVGAFTPTCQAEHMPSFVSAFDDMKNKGVKTVNCVSVNDPFVMEAFGKSLDPKGKVRFLADTKGEFTQAVDLSLDVTDLLGNVRSQRFAMVVENGKVTGLNVESDASKATCSKAADVLAML